MKTAKKALLLVLCAIALVVASVMGTLAYLKSETAVVKNTMTAGKVAITLDEALVDVYGNATSGRTNLTDDDTTNNGNTYKLISGHTYTKDPTVTVVKGSERSYVRMVVTIDHIEALKKACGDEDASEPFYPENFVDGSWDRATWNCISMSESNNVATYVFEYKEAVAALSADNKLPALFTKFKMPDTATNDQILDLEGMNIEVKAYACQADGFADSYAAFSASFPQTVVDIAK